MRSSVRKNDPGRKNFVPGTVITVDGQRVARCFTADEELGKAWCFKVDEKGKPVLNKTRQALEEVCFEGVVKIIQPKGSAL